MDTRSSQGVRANQAVSPPSPPTARPESGDDLEHMLCETGEAAEINPSEQPGSPEDVLGPIKARLDALAKDVGAVGEKLSGLTEEFEGLRSRDDLLVEMHKQCRAAGERVLESQVLEPIFLTLIGIADRGRQQASKMQSVLDAHAASTNRAGLLAIQRIVEARAADRIEIEAVLANHGVESFETTDSKFDPTAQKCISRVEREDASLHGRVAQRLLPGYRRNGKVLRPEYVSVYITQGTVDKGE
jgi:hypothetical protein